MTGDPSFLSKTPEQVERGIAREIRKSLPILDERDTAAIAMVPVRPVLEAMAAEIARQAARRRRVVLWLTKLAADYRELASNGRDLDRHTSASLTYRSVAQEIAKVLHGLLEATADELGPYAGDVMREVADAEAAVRTDERKRLAARFRKLGMPAAANECDPLGPLQGARASGGTE